jgi:hypothetical protein
MITNGDSEISAIQERRRETRTRILPAYTMKRRAVRIWPNRVRLKNACADKDITFRRGLTSDPLFAQDFYLPRSYDFDRYEIVTDSALHSIGSPCLFSYRL